MATSNGKGRRKPRGGIVLRPGQPLIVIPDEENGEEIENLSAFPLRREDQATLIGKLDRAGVPCDRPIAVLNANAGALALFGERP